MKAEWYFFLGKKSNQLNDEKIRNELIKNYQSMNGSFMNEQILSFCNRGHVLQTTEIK